MGGCLLWMGAMGLVAQRPPTRELRQSVHSLEMRELDSRISGERAMDVTVTVGMAAAAVQVSLTLLEPQQRNARTPMLQLRPMLMMLC